MIVSIPDLCTLTYSARWVPHMFTGEQNRQQVKVAEKLLQMSQTYDKKQFANVIACDENWVYYFEPVRKVSNKISATNIADTQ